MKQNLANFITTLLLPGIPLLEWGEEQAFYVLDNTANNYVFGRQSMSSATAWQDHGCYTVGNKKLAAVGYLFRFLSTLETSTQMLTLGLSSGHQEHMTRAVSMTGISLITAIRRIRSGIS